MSGKVKNIIFAFTICILFMLGVGIRRHVLETQKVVASDDLPFTLESALHFRLIQTISEGKALPTIDKAIEHPAGVNLRRTYTIGSEYVYAGLAACMPRWLSLTERVRWSSVLWFCLGIPLLACWIKLATGNNIAGLVAGAFYAVAVSAVVRSTGQELSRENFALPLLIGHLACHYSGRRNWCWQLTSALLLAAAAASWDLIQFYVYLWVLLAFIRLLRKETQDWSIWVAELVALCFTALLLPYAREHSWFFSPFMLSSFSIIFILLARRRPQKRFIGYLAALICLLLIILVGFNNNYGHFGELLMAKIRFLNIKPTDPGYLTFNQRILWTPALHSANWNIIKSIFPGILWLTLIGSVVLLIRQFTKPDSKLLSLLICCFISFISFLLFVRLYVFVAIFAAGLIGFLVAYISTTRRWSLAGLTIVLIAGWFVEFRATYSHAAMWRRPNTYYRQVTELVDWLSNNVAPEAVLANFGVSGSILTYGNCPIVLHPKFENDEIRRRVENYGKALFKGNERDFRDWADKYDTDFYVHSLGEFSEIRPEYQMRYMVNALNPQPKAAARLFENNPEKGRYFKLIWENQKYRVFSILSNVEEKNAQRFAKAAQVALQHGRLQEAEDKAAMSLNLDGRNTLALDVIRHVMSLREKGFEYDGGEGG